MTRHERPDAHYSTVGCLLHPDDVRRLEMLARHEGLGKSAYLRRLFLQHLDARDRAAPAEAAA